jgi:hypothetical protein
VFTRNRKNSHESFLTSLGSDDEDVPDTKASNNHIPRTCSMPEGVAGCATASEQYQMEGKSIGTTSTLAGFQNKIPCRKYSQDSRTPSSILSFLKSKRAAKIKKELVS